MKGNRKRGEKGRERERRGEKGREGERKKRKEKDRTPSI